MNKKEIENLFYIKKDYSKIKELLKNSEESWSFVILGKIFLKELDVQSAYKYFLKAGKMFECGYCKFISGNLSEAKSILSPIKEKYPNANWVLFLINLVQDKVSNIYPTYFQIRNFYEQDIEMLFKLGQHEIIEKIIGKISCFEVFNKEIYKYTARVLYNNNYNSQAEKFLKKSLEIYYKDPETHYLLGELYLKENKKYLAKQEFIKADEVNQGYIPAVAKLKEIIN